jgi:hypothetical protein
MGWRGAAGCVAWMTTRTNKVGPPDVRARLAVFHGTSIGAEEALGFEDSEITFDLMMRSGVKAVNLQTAVMGPTSLKARGAHTPQQLRQLGFDALHLCDADFCNEASMAYGAEPVVGAFLSTAKDAVSVAGTEAVHILNISTEQLLSRCAGFPGEAAAVTPGVSLHGVRAVTLLDAGLRAETLKQCGYGLAAVVEQVAPSGHELGKFGYTM